MYAEKILIVTATYNEAGNIKLLLENIWKHVPDADVLVIDDNSPDGTGYLLNKIAHSNKKLSIVNRSDKLGLGSAHLLGIIHAIHMNYGILVTMDADLSHDPSNIPSLIEGLNNSDFVIDIP